MICSQVKSTVFAALLSYIYLGALGCQFAGSMLSSSPVMRKLRHVGLLVVFGACGFMYWALLINPWCTMFFFKQTFSLN